MVFQTLLIFVKIQKLDPIAMFFDGMIDELDDLVTTNPAMWMKDQRRRPLF